MHTSTEKGNAKKNKIPFFPLGSFFYISSTNQTHYEK